MSNIELEIENHIPEWLAWQNIQEKYPNKWVMLGYKDNGDMDNIEADVVGLSDTSEEIIDFFVKYKHKFKLTGLYLGGFSTRWTSPIKRKKRVIVSMHTAISNK